MSFSSARADRVTAIVFFALGLAMLVGGYTMDRLEIRQIHPASIPGLLPMILGAVLMLCAVLLFAQAKGAGEARPVVADGLDERGMDEVGVDAGGDAPGEARESTANLLFAAGYSVVYALVLVGTMHFALATAIYIAAFVIHFTYDRQAGLRPRLIAAGWAVLFAVLAAGAIALLFRYAFLVRLP